MMNSLHPGLLLIISGFCFSILPERLRNTVLIFMPLLCLGLVWSMPDSNAVAIQFLDYQLEPWRIDVLGRLFITVFCIMLFAGAVYCYRQAQVKELTAAYIYAGSAIGVVLANDLITLFIFWEFMALASTIIVWSGNSRAADRAGFRYLLMHLLGGVILMSGIVSYAVEFNSIRFENMSLDSIGSCLILAGFLINAGAPPLSAWLADAYPEASFSGMVFLSAFTTKTAVYVLMRGFPGTEILIFVGLYMIFYGIIYALLENDMRRILAYSIVNQVGFMVCGIGIGTEMALNGAAAHAFTHIIYKALLLMSAGAVLYQTGKRKCTDLGGLFQSMPITMWCGIIGAMAISAFPLTSGFISKSMVTQSSVDEHLFLVWLSLQAASAGVFLHAGIKFPWFVFFQKDSGLRPEDPPVNMRFAMIFFAFLCIALGLFPGLLYGILPYTVNYRPYTAEHVLAQLQLLLFSGLAFFVLLPLMKRTLTISLDFDWFYRKCFFSLLALAERITGRLKPDVSNSSFTFFSQPVKTRGQRLVARFEGDIGWSVSVILLIFAISLLVVFT